MAMSFVAATTDYVNLGQPSVLNLLPRTEWTISLWALASGSIGFGTFLCKGDSTGANRQFQFTYGGTEPFKLEATVGGTFYSSGVTGSDGVWHHCVLRDINNGGTYQFQLFKDAVQAGTTQNSGTGTLAADVLIGSRRATTNTGTGYLLTGSLDDIRVYNRALSLPEIETLYGTRGRDNLVNGLVGRWLFLDSPPGTVSSGTGQVKDMSDQGTHGTASGAPSFSESYAVSYRRRFIGEG
jgi:hypothetical protein